MRKKHPPRSVWTNPIHFIACGFGFGATGIAPGTLGTLVSIPFYLLLRHIQIGWYAAVIFVSFFIGIWLCGKTAKHFGVHDHPAIVWDEIVGFWITMFLAPLKMNWLWIILGFLLFRLFDIWKPWPIKWFDQQVHGGFGIMIDDVFAAIYAWLILQVIIFGALR